MRGGTGKTSKQGREKRNGNAVKKEGGREEERRNRGSGWGEVMFLLSLSICRSSLFSIFF